jgi:hypothetical protein
MDIDRKFQDVTSGKNVKITSLEVDRKYPVTYIENIVLMSIRDALFHTVKVFMSKRYGSAFRMLILRI